MKFHKSAYKYAYCGTAWSKMGDKGQIEFTWDFDEIAPRRKHYAAGHVPLLLEKTFKRAGGINFRGYSCNLTLGLKVHGEMHLIGPEMECIRTMASLCR